LRDATIDALACGRGHGVCANQHRFARRLVQRVRNEGVGVVKGSGARAARRFAMRWAQATRFLEVVFVKVH